MHLTVEEIEIIASLVLLFLASEKMDLSSPDIPIKQVLTAQVAPVKSFTKK